jgi:hypothetical protein
MTGVSTGPLAVPCTPTVVDPPGWITRFQSSAVSVGLIAVPPIVAWYDAVSRAEPVQVQPTFQDDETTVEVFLIVIWAWKPPGQAETVCQVAVHDFPEPVVVVVVVVVVVGGVVVAVV